MQWPTFESLWLDTKYALRQIFKSPGISLIAVLTLAFGIGANTAIFTLTWAIVLRSLPVPHPEQLVQYGMRNGGTLIGLSGPEYNALRQMQKTSVDLLAWTSDRPSVRTGNDTRREEVQFLTGNAFKTLGLRPYLGNFFSDAQQNAAILSYEYWQQQFHGSSDVIGQSLFVGGHPVVITGVMPEAFTGLTANFHPAVYLPMKFGNVLYGKDYTTAPGHLGFYAMGRLKPGATLTQATAEAKALEPTIRKEADPSGIYLGQFFQSFHLDVQSGRSGISWVKMAYARPLFVLELLVIFLIVLCCLNTALVMLARVSGRQQEFAVRSALGASRSNLISQVLLETILLTLPGLLGGIFVGWLAARMLVILLASRSPLTDITTRPNAIILAVNTGAAVLVAVGAGLWPALRASRTDPSLDLKTGGHSVSARHSGGWAVSLQVAVCLTLVACATLVAGVLSNLMAEHSGFRPQGAAMAKLDLQSLKLTDAEAAALENRLLNAVRQKPGVTAAGLIDIPPFQGSFGASRMFSIDNRHAIHSDPSVFFAIASSGYFAAAGTGVIEGNAEASSSNISGCALSRSAAKFFFPDENAVGQLIYFSVAQQPDGTNLDLKNACRVAAVVDDANFVSLHQPAPRMVYSIIRPEMPVKNFDQANHLVVRAGSDSLAVAALEQAGREVLPPLVEVKIQTFTQLVHQDLARERMLVSLSGIFAILALLLTALGLYGLLMRDTVLRTREIGIRIAFGAPKGAIVRAVSSRAGFQAAVGLVTGAAVSVLVIQAVRQLLELPQAGAFFVLAISAAIVSFVILLAAMTPVSRALSIDPMEALRAE